MDDVVGLAKGRGDLGMFQKARKITVGLSWEIDYGLYIRVKQIVTDLIYAKPSLPTFHDNV